MKQMFNDHTIVFLFGLVLFCFFHRTYKEHGINVLGNEEVENEPVLVWGLFV